MTLLPKTALPQLYATMMREIKLRLEALDDAFAITAKNQKDFKAILQCEFCYLQLRRCSELIVQAALLAHNGIEQFRRKALMKEWKALDLIKMLAELSDDAFPEPTRLANYDASGGADAFIESLAPTNRIILSKIYTDCGDKLHTGSLRQLITKGGKRYDLKEIQEARNFIIRLLNNHAILLPDRKSVMLVFMCKAPDNDVHCELSDLELEEGRQPGEPHPSPPASLKNGSWTQFGTRPPLSK